MRTITAIQFEETQQGRYNLFYEQSTMKNVRFNVVETKIVLDKKKEKKVEGALNIILFLLIMVSTLISLGWV